MWTATAVSKNASRTSTVNVRLDRVKPKLTYGRNPATVPRCRQCLVIQTLGSTGREVGGIHAASRTLDPSAGGGGCMLATSYRDTMYLQVIDHLGWLDLYVKPGSSTATCIFQDRQVFASNGCQGDTVLLLTEPQREVATSMYFMRVSS